MGIPNLPPKINSNINLDKKDILDTFLKSMNISKESINKFFESNEDLTNLLSNRDNITEEQLNKVQNIMSENLEILNEKDQVEEEKINYVKKHFNIKNKKEIKSLVYVLFVLLIIVFFNKSHNCYYYPTTNCYNPYY